MEKLGFWSILIIVFVAELPCLLRTMALQMHNKGIWSVIWGTTAGNVCALVIGVALAKIIQIYARPEWFEWMERGAALLLIVLGVYLLFVGHD